MLLDPPDDPVVNAIRLFVKQEVIPVARELELADEYQDALVEQMREMGLFGAIIPEAYGGAGLSITTYAGVIEELSRGWMSLAGVINSHLMMAYAVLGFGSELGAIAPNAFADLVFLDLGNINYIPLRDALLQLVNGESGTAVDAVMVGGRFVLRDGRIVGVDEAKMRRDAEAARERLDQANESSLRTARTMEDWVGEFCIAHARSPGLPHRHLAAD